MKHILSILLLSLIIFSCTPKANVTSNNINVEDYEVYGSELVNLEQPKTKDEAFQVFQNLKEGETIPLIFETTINEVCTKKGCWMKLDLSNNEEAFIKMKDYAFFVPTDVASGKKVIVDGVAELKVTSVEQLKHYAEDAGEPKEEIAKITEPEKTYFLMANSILIKK